MIGAAIVSVTFGACGGGQPAGKSPAPAAQAPSTPPARTSPAAAEAAQRYLNAYARKDAQSICALVAQSVRGQLSVKQSCPKTVDATLKGKTFRKLRVRTAMANGATATAALKASPRQIQLTREGSRWRVINGGS